VAKHQIYINDKGQTEYLDLDTGETYLKEVNVNELADYVLRDGRFIPFEQVNFSPQYSPAKGLIFANYLLDGMKIREACAKMEITYADFCTWRRRYEDFAGLIEDARRDRADIYFEKIEEAVERATEDQDSVALARAKVEAYKHLSSISDQRRFGTKTQLSGQIGVAVVAVETGIRRQGDAGFKEEALFGGIEEGQKKIAEAEALVPVVVKPSVMGMPVSEEQKDGKAPSNNDGV